MSGQLLRAISDLLPEGDFCLRSVRPWHSLAFAGSQLCLLATIVHKDHRKLASDFVRILEEHAFTLDDGLVADIAVTEHVMEDSESRLVIHALLLDD